MTPSSRTTQRSEVHAYHPVVETFESVLFSIPLVNLAGYREALVEERDSAEFDRAHRQAGATRVMTWVQPNPPYAVIRWQGENVLDAIGRTATTTDPFMARWRGLIRMFSGPVGAEGVWDASRHRVFFWSTEEEGLETDLRIFHGSARVHEFLTLLGDISGDPALEKVYDRVRREQAVTRVEIWHQRLGDHEVVMRLFEGHNLDAAFAEIGREANDFDRRINQLTRAAMDGSATARSRAELVVDWRA